jgi:hypothetical protein
MALMSKSLESYVILLRLHVPISLVYLQGVSSHRKECECSQHYR